MARCTTTLCIATTLPFINSNYRCKCSIFKANSMLYLSDSLIQSLHVWCLCSCAVVFIIGGDFFHINLRLPYTYKMGFIIVCFLETKFCSKVQRRGFSFLSSDTVNNTAIMQSTRLRFWCDLTFPWYLRAALPFSLHTTPPDWLCLWLVSFKYLMLSHLLVHTCLSVSLWMYNLTIIFYLLLF